MASSRATVVLPVPGGPQNTSEPSERVASMRAERAVGPEQMILPDHLGQRLRAQLVGERPRRVGVEARPRRTGSAPLPRLGARAAHPPRTSTGNLLAAALDGDAPDAGCCRPGDVLQVAGLGDLVVVDRDAPRSPRWKPTLCAGEPSAISTITTPSADASSRSSSASAGDRLATLAPRNGERPRITQLVARRSRARFPAPPRPWSPCRRASRRAGGAAERLRREAVVEARWDRRPSGRRPRRSRRRS